MGTTVPHAVVTVVVVGGDGWRPELPGLRLLARVDDPRRAPRLVGDARPQVVLVGLGRDRDAVLAVVPELTARAPGASVLAVSVRDVSVRDVSGREVSGPEVSGPEGAPGSDPAADVLAAVRAGATGYLVAPADPGALVDAVRRTAAGESVFGPGLAEVVLEVHGRPAGAVERLTHRETDVLRLVVEGLTARQVATRLVLSPRTVENHVQRMLRRLGLPNRTALVRHAIENGLV